MHFAYAHFIDSLFQKSSGNCDPFKQNEYIFMCEIKTAELFDTTISFMVVWTGNSDLKTTSMYRINELHVSNYHHLARL